MTINDSVKPPKSAIFLLVLGLSMAALNGALMKVLSPTVSDFFIVWARYFGFFIIMAPVTFLLVKDRHFHFELIGLVYFVKVNREGETISPFDQLLLAFQGKEMG